MKKDLDKAIDMAIEQKTQASAALFKLNELKKENLDLKQKIQRYRKILNENTLNVSAQIQNFKLDGLLEKRSSVNEQTANSIDLSKE